MMGFPSSESQKRKFFRFHVGFSKVYMGSKYLPIHIPSFSSSLYFWNQGSSYLIYWLAWELGSKYIGNWKIQGIEKKVNPRPHPHLDFF